MHNLILLFSLDISKIAFAMHNFMHNLGPPHAQFSGGGRLSPIHKMKTPPGGGDDEMARVEAHFFLPDPLSVESMQ
jgi:hypothetical protein